MALWYKKLTMKVSLLIVGSLKFLMTEALVIWLYSTAKEIV